MRNRLLVWIRGILCAAAIIAPTIALTACETEEDNPVEEAAEDIEDAVD